jgi:hypothetical protein
LERCFFPVAGYDFRKESDETWCGREVERIRGSATELTRAVIL